MDADTREGVGAKLTSQSARTLTLDQEDRAEAPQTGREPDERRNRSSREEGCAHTRTWVVDVRTRRVMAAPCEACTREAARASQGS